MKLETYIKPTSGILSLYIKRSGVRGFLLGNSIYLRQEIYTDLLSSKPNPRNVAVLIHEEVHYRRMKNMGRIKFWVKYILSRKGRLEEELVAYGEQMKYLKSKGLDYDIDKIARSLSGWVYLWCTSYVIARTKLQEMWGQAK